MTGALCRQPILLLGDGVGLPGLVLDLSGGPNPGPALTCSVLQGWGSCGLSSPSLAFLQGTALVIHTTALELTQQVKEALLVRRRGPGNTLRGEGDQFSPLCLSFRPSAGLPTPATAISKTLGLRTLPGAPVPNTTPPNLPVSCLYFCDSDSATSCLVATLAWATPPLPCLDRSPG